MTTQATRPEGFPLCGVCGKECGSHTCKVCGKPTHGIPPCAGEQHEEGFGAAVTCKQCVDDYAEECLWRDDSDDGISGYRDSMFARPRKRGKIYGWENEYEDSPPQRESSTDNSPVDTESNHSEQSTTSAVSQPIATAHNPQPALDEEDDAIHETPVQIKRRRLNRTANEDTSTRTKKASSNKCSMVLGPVSSGISTSNVYPLCNI
ncbi:uncharacterized protein [Antedon mediterranea]|uniref:uncharacterized protein isoform X2 n=1 Tax=Antedon mediterranea TaxID=105859 RepID=UPI003AF669FF